MRIGIDIRSLIFRKTGINQYTKNIVKSLAKIDKDNDYILFCNVKSRYDWLKFNNIKEEVIWLPHFEKFTEKFWTEVLLPNRLASKKIDLFHSPRFTLPQKKPCKFIITMHDLAFKKFPQLVKKEEINVFRNQIEAAVNRADKIIADSQNTKKDLINLFNIRNDKIEVIYLGVDEVYHPIRTQELLRETKNKYNLPREFILFVGTIEPRKNLKRLIEAFYELKKNKSIEHGLVIVGEKGWLCDDIFETLGKLHLNQDVIFAGYIPESELPLIYNAADLFVFPSLYEGFGLPPLEAMACGVPVVTSNVSSLPEVVGDAAILVDPYNIQAIAEAIEQVLENNNLREKMIEKGFNQAKKFSWEKAARETLNLYYKCLAG